MASAELEPRLVTPREHPAAVGRDDRGIVGAWVEEVVSVPGDEPERDGDRGLRIPAYDHALAGRHRKRLEPR